MVFFDINNSKELNKLLNIENNKKDNDKQEHSSREQLNSNNQISPDSQFIQYNKLPVFEYENQRLYDSYAGFSRFQKPSDTVDVKDNALRNKHANPKGFNDCCFNKSKKRINIEYICEKGRRGVTFSKRKKGIFKKIKELSILTGSEIMVVIKNENSKAYFQGSQRFVDFMKTHGSLFLEYIGCTQIVCESEENPPRVIYPGSSIFDQNSDFLNHKRNHY